MYLILLEQDRKDESTFLLIIRLNKLWNKILKGIKKIDGVPSFHIILRNLMTHILKQRDCIWL